jgi:methoxymalonate biosynthesis acyl carrier protein
MTESISADAPVESTERDPIEKTLREFLLAKTKRDWDVEVDLFTSGAVSSLFAMELVVFIETTFDVAIEGPDLSLDNFRTVRAMSSLVLRLRKGVTGA